MVIELTGEQEAMALRVAAQCRKTPTEIVLEALEQWDWVDPLADDPKEKRTMEERLAEADREDLLLTHEEVGRRRGLIPAAQ